VKPNNLKNSRKMGRGEKWGIRDVKGDIGSAILSHAGKLCVVISR